MFDSHKALLVVYSIMEIISINTSIPITLIIILLLLGLFSSTFLLSLLSLTFTLLFLLLSLLILVPFSQSLNLIVLDSIDFVLDNNTLIDTLRATIAACKDHKASPIQPQQFIVQRQQSLCQLKFKGQLRLAEFTKMLGIQRLIVVWYGNIGVQQCWCIDLIHNLFVLFEGNIFLLLGLLFYLRCILQTFQFLLAELIGLVLIKSQFRDSLHVNLLYFLLLLLIIFISFLFLLLNHLILHLYLSPLHDLHQLLYLHPVAFYLVGCLGNDSNVHLYWLYRVIL